MARSVRVRITSKSTVRVNGRTIGSRSTTKTRTIPVKPIRRR